MLVIVTGLGFIVIRAGQTWVPPAPLTATSTIERLPRVSYPQPDQVVLSPLTVTGEAPGNWFFEASLPVKLLDASGQQLAVAPAQAQGDWMTTNYVPFQATLTFATSTVASSTIGTLIIAKDNPSGLPENDQQMAIPIRFLP